MLEDLLGIAFCDQNSDKECLNICLPIILLEISHFLLAEIIPTILIAIIINNKGDNEEGD
jgi:hypothetical protein